MSEWNQIFWTELDRIATALERIANCLDSLAPEPSSAPETPPCSHPEDQRISFGMTNGQADWQCRICQFRTPCPPLDPETTTLGHR